MSSALIQISSNISTAIVIALVVLVLAVGLMVFLFARSSVQRRGRETRVRERMLEMEREAQFASAADRVPISRNPADVASHIAQLLHDYMSIPVLAVYAGRATDASLSDQLSFREAEASESGLPASVPASLLAEHAWPAIVTLTMIAGQEPVTAPLAEGPAAEQPEERASATVTEEPAAERTEQPAAESSAERQVDESQTPIATTEQVSLRPNVADVMLLPWRGPFGWNGFIVTAARSGIMPEALEPYREPLARLTDRLAVALEFEHSGAVSEGHRQLASLTTDFSRSLISCLDEAAPLDAIVSEVTKLVSGDSAALWRVDEASGMVRMVASHGLRSPEFLPLPVGQGLAGSVAQSAEVLAIEDAPADPRCIFPREARESGIVSYLGAPLSAGGKTLGVIEVHCASRRSWTESDRRALESAAVIIAELIKSADSRGNRLRVESAYLGLSESLQRLRSAEEIKEAVVEVLGHALAASRVVVVEFNDKDQPEPVKQEYRQPSAKSALGATFGEGLFAGVAASVGGQPIAIADSQERSLAGVDTAAELGVLSELAAPIRFEGKTRAIVYVHQCDRVREWEPEEIEFAERVVRQLSLSLWNLLSLEAAFSDAQQARADAQRAREIGSEADISRRVETEVRQQIERVQEERQQAQGSAQQLLEINRLKSEFIVNAGHEMEASLQSVLGLAELLERGSYGDLTPEQREAVHGIYVWARRIKSDVDALVEYGSARSRRLESSGAS